MLRDTYNGIRLVLCEQRLKLLDTGSNALQVEGDLLNLGDHVGDGVLGLDGSESDDGDRHFD